MSITQSICASFKLERYEGIHDFTSDTFKIALYDSTASLNYQTTGYTTSGEISGTGYTAGGETLLVNSGYPKLNPTGDGDVPIGSMVLVDFVDITWNYLSVISVRGALIYNSSKSNRSIFCLDFGGDLYVNGMFTIQWPTPDIFNAILRSV